MMPVASWGRIGRPLHRVYEPAFRDELVDLFCGAGTPALGFGLGRSYGDVCLNERGTLIKTAHLDRLLAADWEQGIVRAEAGLTIDVLLRLAVPRGFFVPITPGTKFVTLGGAVANDVHGKNHEGAGTFGCHVLRLGLLRSTGEILELTPEQNRELFTATIGGLGLTGLILWVELALERVTSAEFDTETLRLNDLDDFFDVAEASGDWPYTIAWVDCLARGAVLGRGLFTRARHAEGGALRPHAQRPLAKVPVDAPFSALSAPMVRAFNAVYLRKPGTGRPRRMHYDSFLYPLDGIGNWNKLYGRTGFFQHQSVVPLDKARSALRRLLDMTAEAGQGSFLVVLKLFGSRRSPGLLSFPMEGATFALDLPNRGAMTRTLLERMAEVVLEAGGRLYPAKDATMAPDIFRAGYPNWRDLEAKRDPAVMSDFWRRVTRSPE
jgi:FAD/FMN-containing dehydrogenase